MDLKNIDFKNKKGKVVIKNNLNEIYSIVVECFLKYLIKLSNEYKLINLVLSFKLAPPMCFKPILFNNMFVYPF